MQFHLQIQGTAPYLMNGDRGINPKDEQARRAKELTNKKQRTIEQEEERLYLWYQLAIHYDERDGFFIPGGNVEACLYEAAKDSRKGPKFKRGVCALDDRCPIKHYGPKTPEELWNDPVHRYETSMRTLRSGKLWMAIPRFPEWSIECRFTVDKEQFGEDDFREAVRFGGLYIGIGGFRPRFGVYTAVVTRQDAAPLMMEERVNALAGRGNSDSGRVVRK